jgi:hypothetical protein
MMSAEETGDAALIAELRAHEACWNGLIDRLRVRPGIDQRQLSLAAAEGESAYMRALRAIVPPRRRVTGGVPVAAHDDDAN